MLYLNPRAIWEVKFVLTLSNYSPSKDMYGVSASLNESNYPSCYGFEYLRSGLTGTETLFSRAVENHYEDLVDKYSEALKYSVNVEV